MAPDEVISGTMPVKCLIPAAGKGTRMRPLTHTLPKAMLPVAGKPTIFHIIDRAAKAGVQDFVIITGYLRELMESEILAAYPGLNIEFVEQNRMPTGMACLPAGWGHTMGWRPSARRWFRPRAATPIGRSC